MKRRVLVLIDDLPYIGDCSSSPVVLSSPIELCCSHGPWWLLERPMFDPGSTRTYVWAIPAR